MLIMLEIIALCQEYSACEINVTLSRSEGSLSISGEMLRCTQHDNALLLTNYSGQL
jgi:hypothetical protein